jgi:hypothetical protein
MRLCTRDPSEWPTTPQVVFEVLSPNSRVGELVTKFQFYDRFDVEEYYIFDPHKIDLTGWIRRGEDLVKIEEADGWTSPRLGVRFDLSSGDLQVFGPDGRTPVAERRAVAVIFRDAYTGKHFTRFLKWISK